VALAGPAGLHPVLAQGTTLVFAFFLRFLFVDKIVYGTARHTYVTYISRVVQRSRVGSDRPGTTQPSLVLEEAA
jgi:hypothetical protein